MWRPAVPDGEMMTLSQMCEASTSEEGEEKKNGGDQGEMGEKGDRFINGRYDLPLGVLVRYSCFRLGRLQTPTSP